jgi:phage shock protein PspC (stress-responsive transcriptional regulator)
MLADIERSIAEKCQACFAPHKTVITSGEIDRIISEMEPVASQPAIAADAAGAQDSPGPGTGEKTRTESQANKRLYQIREGGIIGGVCLGLATFFNIDVTVIRIVFVLFAVATGGWGILAYAALMYMLPRATTREQAESTSNAPPQWPWDRDGWPWDRHGWPWDRDQKRAWRDEQRATRWRYGGPPPGDTLVIIICVILAFAWLSFWMRGGVLFGGPFFWRGPFF